MCSNSWLSLDHCLYLPSWNHVTTHLTAPDQSAGKIIKKLSTMGILEQRNYTEDEV